MLSQSTAASQISQQVQDPKLEALLKNLHEDLFEKKKQTLEKELQRGWAEVNQILRQGNVNQADRGQHKLDQFVNENINLYQQALFYKLQTTKHNEELKKKLHVQKDLQQLIAERNELARQLEETRNEKRQIENSLFEISEYVESLNDVNEAMTNELIEGLQN